ncbi:uncharacterized protein LOC132908276 [Bombus pascuorum]|uniref:uncharacterized protein LOC132908276 n=1 Tax=Bombus pascuorum TaxID=65598 RepID=UPI00212A2E21|nr:uncharacterized protein LOC132908276 [Bombus pascuorum]
MGEYITLILKQKHVQVNKQKLASRSRYFASLFSHNFNDSHNQEHVINYNIAEYTLQNFVEWVHSETRINIHYQSIKVCLLKFMQNKHFTDLLNLLQLSALFIVDELTSDIVNIIVLQWLSPQKVIEIWLLARELNIKALQDICMSVCLDRFEEIPVDELVKLAADDFVQFLNNVNIRVSSKSYLQNIRSKWMEHHRNSDIAHIKEGRQLKFIKGTVICETFEDETRIGYLCTWDGNVLNKCGQLKSIQHPDRWLFGMQVISRGFNVYTVGGNVGLGGMQFNNVISRYCLLSKKWYYESTMPVPRRHMIAVFLGNKLVIVGGVGKHRLKLNSVNILDIHTGIWKEGMYVPESFTNIPPHCVLNGKLYVLKSSVYIYYPKEDYWKTISIRDDDVIERVDTFLTCNTTLLFEGDEDLDEMIITRIEITKDDSICERGECIKRSLEHKELRAYVVNVERDCRLQLRYLQSTNIGIMILNNACQQNDNRYLHLHTEERDEFRQYIFPQYSCFNIIDPRTLYDTCN